MGGKWLELLKEITPRVERAAALFNPKTHTGQYWGVLDAAAPIPKVIFNKAGVEDSGALARAPQCCPYNARRSSIWGMVAC
jgi:hypothetical protein